MRQKYPKRDKAEAKSKNRLSPKKPTKRHKETKGWNVDTQGAKLAQRENKTHTEGKDNEAQVRLIRAGQTIRHR